MKEVIVLANAATAVVGADTGRLNSAHAQQGTEQGNCVCRG